MAHWRPILALGIVEKMGKLFFQVDLTKPLSNVRGAVRIKHPPTAPATSVPGFAAVYFITRTSCVKNCNDPFHLATNAPSIA